MILLLFLIILPSFAERYGTLEEFCPDNTLPERNNKNIRLCSRDRDCSKDYKCISTIQKHFGVSIKYCCQTRESICSLPPNPGYGDCLIATTTKYYFDTFELRCKPFKFFDCKGINQNQFATMQECTRFCQSTACSAGESLLLSPSNKPVTCANSDACPDGYHCVYDSLFRRHVCCGRTRQGSCPLGTLAYASPRNYQPLRCDHSPVGDNCPPDFLCTGHAQQSFCCTPEYGICPLGQVAYDHPLTGRSMKCDPMRPVSECPANFVCTPAVPGASWGFCCSAEVQAQCPKGSRAYLEPITHHPVKCTVGVSMCGVGFTCQSMTGSIIGFCCTKPRKTPPISAVEVTKDKDRLLPIPHEFHSDAEEKKGISSLKELLQEYESTTRKITQTTSISILSNYLFCPEKGTPIHYEGSQLIMECTPVEGLNNKCPNGSSCIKADGDVYGRSICCKMPPTTTTMTTTTVARVTVPATTTKLPYFIYTVTSRTPNFKIITTKDPFCPSVIAGRPCVPGNPLHCNEVSFFCQYNIILKQYSCCSMEVIGKVRL